MFTLYIFLQDAKGNNKSDQMQDEMLQIQTRYQKEIERLEKENRELRREIILKRQKSGGKRRKMKVQKIVIVSITKQ